MTGSRTQSGPAPTYLRITLGEGTPTPTQSHQADRPASADSMHRAGQRQDRSSSLRCGRSVLTPALTQCCLHGGRKPAKPLLNNLLTHPAPSGMTGKTFIVTGATTGLGKATADALARAGAHAVLAVRNHAKGQVVAEAIAGDTEVRELDLSSLSSVRAFASSWQGPIDV